ncbi:hypothetical protein PF003_g32867 [Phytophthora fragariae]|nr:hypothetical protein PF003_g32867 [Phytophthora fragariae]
MKPRRVGSLTPESSIDSDSRAFATPTRTRHPTQLFKCASPTPAESKRRSGKRLQVSEAHSSPRKPKRSRSERDDAGGIAESVPSRAVTDVAHLSKRESCLQRMQAYRRERARRNDEALEAERRRSREFHEVPERSYIERLVQIRKDVSAQMLNEHIAAMELAAGNPPPSTDTE